jgi:hypothetical protein
VRECRVSHPVDDSRYILVELDFNSEDQAATFLGFLRGNVWSSPETAPGLAGTPRTRILELVDSS